jgi:hypothetical protein
MTPLAPILAQSIRDFFYDAPLNALNDTFDPTVSPMATTRWTTAIGWNGIGEISDAQHWNLTQMIDDAHSRGIKARFWDTPGWPIYARNKVWEVQLLAGLDWLNADNLEAASSF